MDVELAGIADFLSGCAPFDRLPRREVDRLVPSLTQRYHRRGEIVVPPGAANDVLHVVRSGAVEICDPSGALLDLRDVGDCFGYSTLAASGPSRYLMQAAADTLVLRLPREAFEEVAARHPDFLAFFGERTDRIRDELVATRLEAAGGDVLGTTVGDLLTRDPVSAGPDTTIREAAALMTTARVSALLVVDPDGAVVGILTDRDLRSRVLAAGVDPSEPLSGVMTPDPVCVDASARAFDATLVMMDRGVRHLPVLEGGRPVGVVSATGLFRLTQADPVYLAARIDRAPTRAAVAEQVRTLPGMVVEMVRRGASADDVARVVTATADAATRRLVALGTEVLGPAPVPFCWIVLGSQARGELGIASDQDSALVYAERPDDEGERWFDRLTASVRDGLAEAGFPVCPGDMMASNPRWRMTVDEWSRQATTWVQSPESENVLDAQVFFDLRAVAGDPALAERVRAVMLDAARSGTRFQAHLARSAADWRPPLGFFRGLVVERRGEYRNTLDVKAGGLAPVVQIARLHALAAGLPEVATLDRLRAAVRAGALQEADAADLVESFAYLRGLQTRHHADLVAGGAEPDNHLDPSTLSTRDRHRLRVAFRAISEAQQALAMRYPIRSM